MKHYFIILMLLFILIPNTGYTENNEFQKFIRHLIKNTQGLEIEEYREYVQSIMIRINNIDNKVKEKEYGSIVLLYYNKKLTEKESDQYINYVYKYCEGTEIDPDLVISIICNESNVRSDAISNVGALGLMQIQPKVWCKYFGIQRKDLKNPELNIKYGIKILEILFKRYKTITNTLNGYNVGNLREMNWNYIQKILDLYYQIKKE